MAPGRRRTKQGNQSNQRVIDSNQAVRGLSLIHFHTMNDKTTLDINPETVGYIVNLARELYAEVQMVSAEEEPETPRELEAGGVPEHRVDPIYVEFKTAIEDLEPDQQVQLVALMWLGRGSFTDWDSAVEEARDNWNSKTADYLLGTPLVADYLEEALNQMGYSGEDSEI